VRSGLPHVVAVGPAGACAFHRFRVSPARGARVTEWGILAYNADTLAVPDPVKHSPPLLRQERTLTYERPRTELRAAVSFLKSYSAASR
jgi:hypothetical protein